MEAGAGIRPAHRCFADTRVFTSPSGHICLYSTISLRNGEDVLTISATDGQAVLTISLRNGEDVLTISATDGQAVLTISLRNVEAASLSHQKARFSYH